MTKPGTDPNYPAYGHGDGTSPLATNGASFEVPPKDNIQVRTDTNHSRRERKTQSHELGFTIPSMAAHEETPTSEIDVAPMAAKPPLPAGDPNH